MGSCKVVVLHTPDGLMMDLGEMANELKERSRWVAQGGLHDWEAVDEYLRGRPNHKIGEVTGAGASQDCRRHEGGHQAQHSGRLLAGHGWIREAPGMHWNAGGGGGGAPPPPPSRAPSLCPAFVPFPPASPPYHVQDAGVKVVVFRVENVQLHPPASRALVGQAIDVRTRMEYQEKLIVFEQSLWLPGAAAPTILGTVVCLAIDAVTGETIQPANCTPLQRFIQATP